VPSLKRGWGGGGWGGRKIHEKGPPQAGLQIMGDQGGVRKKKKAVGGEKGRFSALQSRGGFPYIRQKRREARRRAESFHCARKGTFRLEIHEKKKRGGKKRKGPCESTWPTRWKAVMVNVSGEKRATSTADCMGKKRKKGEKFTHGGGSIPLVSNEK